ncbi:MAG: UDP-3-O-(3-hydroxymyristoyl)glucosamine N-acyltransferase [Prochlorothrix sp.]|nr:UDP-3-O-(3-hydroxymyristoyl)glucosamine N-acyltransferase [Prochlorothrix sp.]
MFKLQDLAQPLGATIEPQFAAVEIQGVASIEDATPQDITFLGNAKYLKKLQTCQAGALIVDQKFTPPQSAVGADSPFSIPLVRVEQPYLAFAKALELFYATPNPAASIHPTAVVGANVSLGEGVSIGPYVVIGDGVKLGDRVTIRPHCTIYEGVEIGADSYLHSQVTIREGVKIGARVLIQNGVVIGADGFGFVPLKDGSFYKILQAGTVTIGDDVEVQALSAIDRATIGTTVIGTGSKIDNLVQVGHGSKIGHHSLLCGQAGLAGSTTLGNHVILAGQVGAAGHLTIGDGTQVAAGSGVNNDVAPGSTIGGYPAMDHRLWLRTVAAIKELPKLVQRIRKLEQQLDRQGES